MLSGARCLAPVLDGVHAADEEGHGRHRLCQLPRPLSKIKPVWPNTDGNAVQHGAAHGNRTRFFDEIVSVLRRKWKRHAETGSSKTLPTSEVRVVPLLATFFQEVDIWLDEFSMKAGAGASMLLLSQLAAVLSATWQATKEEFEAKQRAGRVATCCITCCIMLY